MLKQGVVQESLADLTGPRVLPPLHSLPQWSRINTLDKARYPKPFLKVGIFCMVLMYFPKVCFNILL